MSYGVSSFLPAVTARLCALVVSCVVACGCGGKSAAVTPAPIAPAHVELTYLGVAGFEVTTGAHTLLIDPYFSRLPVDSEDAVITPDSLAIAQHTPEHVDVILVGHSHYDHLLDVPTIAAKTGATVVGSESTANVLRAAAIPAHQIVVAHGGETLDLVPFTVRAIRGLHSLVGKPSLPIPAEVNLPMSAASYAEGGTLHFLVTVEGRSILFIGSANFIESELTGLHPDVAVIATGLREKIPDYSCRLMRALGNPKLVLADHFDAHWEPLGPKQMDIGDAGRASLAAFSDEIHRCSPATEVVIPIHFQPRSI